ncbi:MAG: DUF3027 domain-containing protein [Micrococcus sp.]|nr:DUF3027 domain-containing protein [Micrococcus sp.]
MTPRTAEVEAGTAGSGTALDGTAVNETTLNETAGATGTGTAEGTSGTPGTVQTATGTVRIPPKPTRAPRRRAPKLDELLAAAVDEARAALTAETGLAEDGQVGPHAGVVADDDRLVTHRFSAMLPGYGGWEWFATLARAPRSKVITVCEVGLLPGKDAILAPDWVPWSERVSQEEKVRLDAIAAGEDPEKAVARARGEAGQGPGPGPEHAEAQAEAQDDGTAQDRTDRQAAADLTDEETDAADADAGTDAADPDAGDEADAQAGSEERPW